MSSSEFEEVSSTGGSTTDGSTSTASSSQWMVDPSSANLSTESFIDRSGSVPSVRWGALGGYIIRSLIWGVFTAIIIIWTNFIEAVQGFLGGIAAGADRVVDILTPAELFTLAFGDATGSLPASAFAFITAFGVVLATLWVLNFAFRVMFR